MMVVFGRNRVLPYLLTVVLIARCVLSELHRVGGKKGWTPDTNYTEWASSEHFYVNEWLIFVFDKHYYNVLEVNKTSYENCNDQNFIQNITRGGRDVFQLTEARPYYFLSGGGYCWHGMKLAFTVEEVPPAPAPAPAKDGSPSYTVNLMLSFSALSMALALAILFKLY